MLPIVNVMREHTPEDWGYYLYNRQGGVHDPLSTDKNDYHKGSVDALNEARDMIRLSVYLNRRAHGHTDEEASSQAQAAVERFDTWRLGDKGV